MIIFTIFVLMFIGGVTWLRVADSYHNEGPILLTICSVVCFLIALMIMCCNHTEDEQIFKRHAQLSGVIELTDTYDDELLSKTLRIALGSEIEKINGNIENARCYNSGIFDIFIGDELEHLAPIE